MKPDQQQQARNLYFQSELTQMQIAEQVGVTRKTISLWINEGKWNALKEMSRRTPALMIEEMFGELMEIQTAIQSREPGMRFATPAEAEVRRKLLASLKYVKEQQGSAAHMEVLMNFIDFLRRLYPDLAVPVTKAADHYLKGEKKLGQKNKFIPYTLSVEDIGTEPSAPLLPTSSPVFPTKNAETRKKPDYTGYSRWEREQMEAFDEYVAQVRNGMSSPNNTVQE